MVISFSKFLGHAFLATSESGHEGTRKMKFPQFNGSIHMSGTINLVEEMKFKNFLMFRMALKEYSIQTGFDFLYRKNDTSHITAVCIKKYG